MINGQVIQIEEVLERTTQGVTEPFLCRGTNGVLYYVKGHGAGRKSLVAEWISGCMAQTFGIPIAPFFVAEVDPAIIEYGPPHYRDLGSGYVFASQRIENVMELARSNIKDIPMQLQSDVIVFDYWVRNQDRILTDMGGNPNLLWNPATKDLLVIDHNQAFDPDFDCDIFFEGHAFSHAWDIVFEDLFERQRYEDRMRRALGQFEDACDRMPDSWLWLADDLPLKFTFEDARSVLAESIPHFWRRR
ncbi:HipA family kinase [Paraburkholderia sp. BCC1884]|uniref:HipA family kinase n=1 Tax=Paraburkholderia sp. BCC1884 TaxID=2562668 RepID=UPI00118320BD|nr:HipA family kinase [Paraburkholderia sp. BCC1884]